MRFQSQLGKTKVVLIGKSAPQCAAYPTAILLIKIMALVIKSVAMERGG
jgi:hypothetical protein